MEEYDGQELFDHWNPRIRQPVELETYPVLTNDDPPMENHVYTGDGRRIRRRIGVPVNEDEYCGTLLNLETISDFFTNPAFDIDDPELDAVDNNQPIHNRNIELYPQAFLGNKGHYQSSHLPTPFKPILESINADVIDPTLDEGMACGPVTGSYCQGYNRALHRIRFRTDSHDVQLAEQTAHAASAFVTDRNDRTKADAIRNKLHDKGLAFTRLESRLQSPGLSKALRLENNYHIDCHAIDPVKCTAMYVCFYPLSNSYSRNMQKCLSLSITTGQFTLISCAPWQARGLSPRFSLPSALIW